MSHRLSEIMLSLVSSGTVHVFLWWMAHKVGGRSFQTRGPETANLRDSYVIVLVLGTIRSPRAAERRQDNDGQC